MSREHIIETWRDTILKLAEKGKRLDGRGFGEYREIVVNVGKIENAEGSAVVKFGNTIVAAGVKLDVGQPFPDQPEKGILIVSAEFTPLADPTFEPGPPGPDAIELARVVDRALREGEVLDTTKLCIKPGELVWKVFVDIYVYNNDGNLFDAAYLASLLALKNAVFPKLENDKVVFGEKTDQKLPIQKDDIFMVTFAKIGDKIFVDPTKIEEEVAEAFFSVATDGKYVYAIQKRGEGLFKEDEIIWMINKAKELVENFFKKGKWKEGELW